MYNKGKNMHKIHLVTDCPFEFRDYDRFGIECLIGQGFKYHVWDLSPILAPSRFQGVQSAGRIHQFPGYHPLFEKAETLSTLKAFAARDVVISIVGARSASFPYLRALSQSSAKLVGLRLGMIPKSHVTKTKTKQKRSFKSLLSAIKGRINSITGRITSRGIRPPDLFLIAGTVAHNELKTHSPSNLISTISFDYQTYLSELSSPSPAVFDPGFILYLDEYTPFHPDWAHVGIPPSCTADELYPRLRRFFDELEYVTGKKIVIAAHPRSEYAANTPYFGGRPLFKGMTPALIRDCEFVLAHGSTSVSYAVLFQKPILFITSRIFSPYEQFSINTMAESLSKSPFHFDSPASLINLVAALEMNKAAYANYRESYLKAPKTREEKIWVAFGSYLKNLEQGDPTL